MTFRSFNAVNDEYISSSSNEDIDGENVYQLDTGITQSQQFITELHSSVKEHHINLNPCSNTLTNYFTFLYQNDLVEPKISVRDGIAPHIELLSTVLYHTIHLDQFPKPSNESSEKLPCSYAGFNARTSYSSEFPSLLSNFFKKVYTSIRPRIKLIPLISPKKDRFPPLNGMRNESPTNRIMYHYIGYGFPDISEIFIPCSENSIYDFNVVEIGQIFMCLRPPLWFIFDCNKAALALKGLAKSAEDAKIMGLGDVDWDDWICMCATSENENLPKDSHLPKDLLTQILFNPLQMIISHYILNKYRLSFASDKIPLEIPFKSLWDLAAPVGKLMNDTLTTITDAIACDALPPNIYSRFFRLDTATATLFRNFLVAQYILAGYDIHPKCNPSIPNLSRHPLWKKWEYIIDNAINPGERSVPDIIKTFYSRLVSSVEMNISTNHYENISPYHNVFLFHILIQNPNNKEVISMIPKIASNTLDNHQGFTSAAVFPILMDIFSKQKPGTEIFHSLLYTISVLLFNNSAFESEIRTDTDISFLINVIFDHSINLETRVLATAVVSILVSSYEKFLKICNEFDFLAKVCLELQSVESEEALWLLILIWRTFSLYSPSTPAFVSIGLHVQVAAFVFHQDPVLRSVAASVLCTFLQPFESTINTQLLYLALPLVVDADFHCRFYVLQIVKKILLSFNDFKPLATEYKPCSLQDVVGIFFTNGTPALEIDGYLIAVDDEINSPLFINKICDRCRALVTFFQNDPHPIIQKVATSIVEYLSKRDETDSDVDDDIDFPHEYGDLTDPISYGDDLYSELLQTGAATTEAHFSTLIKIMIHKHTFYIKEPLTSECPKVKIPKSDQISEITNIKFSPISNLSLLRPGSQIVCASFHPTSQAFAIATKKEIIIVDAKGERRVLEAIGNIISIQYQRISGYDSIIYSTEESYVVVQPDNLPGPISVFRASPIKGPIQVAAFDDYIMTMNTNGAECLWQFPQLRLVQETTSDVPAATAVSANNHDSCIIGYADGTIREKYSDGLQKVLSGPNFVPVSFVDKFSNGDVFKLSQNNTIEIIGKSPKTLKLTNPIKSAAIIRNSSMIVLATFSRQVTVINRAGKIYHIFKQSKPSSTVFTHRKLPLIGIADDDGNVIIYELKYNQ